MDEQLTADEHHLAGLVVADLDTAVESRLGVRAFDIHQVRARNERYPELALGVGHHLLLRPGRRGADEDEPGIRPRRAITVAHPATLHARLPPADHPVQSP